MPPLLKKLDTYLDHHLVILLLLLLTLALRLPSLFEPFWYGDENIYLAIGLGIKKGLTLYSGITDFPNKPPLIYYFAAAAGNVFNFRLILLFWTLASTWVFHQLNLRFSATRTHALIAVILFIFLTSTPIIEGNIANAEIFFILPTLISVYLLTSGAGHKFSTASQPIIHFLAGAALGFSFLFKIHVALDIAAIGLFFYLLNHKFNKAFFTQVFLTPKPYLFVLGLTLPIAATLAYFFTLGVSPLTLFSNAAGSSGYLSVWQSGDFLNQYLLFGSLTARLILLGLITLILLIFRNSLGPKLFFTSLWFLFTLFAVLLSARPYPHYLIQLVPPLLLGISALSFKPTLLPIIIQSTLIIILTAAFIRFDFSLWQVRPYYQNFFSYLTGSIDRTTYYRRFDARMPRNYRLAMLVRTITTPDDRIYVWGTEPEIYVLTQRLPIGKLVTSFHVADLDYFDATARAIDDQKPSLIVYLQTEPRPFRQLDLILATDYVQVATIGDPGRTDEQNQGSNALVYKRL